MKEEIEHLKEELPQKSGEDRSTLHGLVLKREQDLELLVRQLDDKVRYSQKIFERQSSGGVRGPGFSDRSPSQSGAYEDPRAGFHNRPPSASGSYDESRAAYPERPPSRAGAYEDSTAGFAERPPSRPGTYEDPRSGFSERPRSRSGAYEETRSVYPQRSFTHGAYQEPRAADFSERPRSRGTVNSWTRPSDDRRSFQGGGGRGFSGNRDADRYKFSRYFCISDFLLHLQLKWQTWTN
ncbi:UNVERIFIED_CONTAM: Eukaryotic translation initiation factor 4B2 [Sesamum radiatum]|uniref:Eukaryotic translation initiation factor 4B2 n=1 Tax=Sesamum radiatum TaxID=300843 RepID=A0AAW2JR43_SESRA